MPATTNPTWPTADDSRSEEAFGGACGGCGIDGESGACVEGGVGSIEGVGGRESVGSGGGVKGGDGDGGGGESDVSKVPFPFQCINESLDGTPHQV